MSEFVLIDTSAWIQVLRRHGDASVRARVNELLVAQRAAWCEMVRLELWRGVRNDEERSVLNVLNQILPRVPITPEVWDKAAEYGARSRAAGLTVPAPDLLIFACARRFGLQLERVDQHYDYLEKLIDAAAE